MPARLIEDGDETQFAALRNFVQQARELRICFTQSKRFLKPSDVEFVAKDASSWFQEAQNFAAMLPSTRDHGDFSAPKTSFALAYSRPYIAEGR